MTISFVPLIFSCLFFPYLPLWMWANKSSARFNVFACWKKRSSIIPEDSCSSGLRLNSLFLEDDKAGTCTLSWNFTNSSDAFTTHRRKLLYFEELCLKDKMWLTSFLSKRSLKCCFYSGFLSKWCFFSQYMHLIRNGKNKRGTEPVDCCSYWTFIAS